MMDKWNQLCFNVKKHSEKNSSEEFFQIEVVNFFEKLGWSQHKNEILTQLRIPIGTKSGIPDIVIKSETKNLFVVELKRPNSKLLIHNIEQLDSYVKLLSLPFGILIGDSIQLYYNEPGNADQIVKVFETNFIEDNYDGARFIELFSKTTFSTDVLIKYCESQIEKLNDSKFATQIVDDLIAGNGVQRVREIITDVLKENYNENIIKLVLDNLNISLTRNTNIEKEVRVVTLDDSLKNVSTNRYEKFSIELVPSNREKFAELFEKEGCAILCYHYEDGRIIEKVWEKRYFDFKKSDVIGNLRSRPEARKGKWKELGMKKLVCKIQGYN